jgi:hypothetical protein
VKRKKRDILLQLSSCIKWMDKVWFLTGIIVAGRMLQSTLHKLYNRNNKAYKKTCCRCKRLLVGVRCFSLLSPCDLCTLRPIIMFCLMLYDGWGGPWVREIPKMRGWTQTKVIVVMWWVRPCSGGHSRSVGPDFGCRLNLESGPTSSWECPLPAIPWPHHNKI